MYVVRPISDRTLFTGRHETSQFSAPWSKTEDLLIREVAHVKGRNLALEVDLTEGDIRVDGRIRANARPSSPAVRVAFESTIHGPLSYATDAFWHWQDNVRAIALGLESLRRFSRYRINKGTEQYTGFKAIGGGATAMPAGPAAMSETEARELVTSVIGVVDRPWDERVKLARKYAHPDLNDGDHDLAYRIDQAAQVLGL